MSFTFSIRRPDDFHVHLRNDERTAVAVNHTIKSWNRALVMPNLVPAVVNVAQALDYKEYLQSFLPKEHKNSFDFLMTLYLTTDLTPDEIFKAKKEGIMAIKLYPHGATTNSDAGVANVLALSEQLKAIEETGMVLCVHGESVASDVDIFDREKVFYTQIAPAILEKYPKIKLCCEHITSKAAVDFIKQTSGNVGATITPQHLLFTRHDMLAGGIKPHLYCLPILKRETDRKALLDFVFEDSGKIFAGTDSAPHVKGQKECACGCAGCYSALHGVLLYAEVFHQYKNLENKDTQQAFERFMSQYGADFYNLPLNDGQIALKQQNFLVPQGFETKSDVLVPLMAGETLSFSFDS